MSDAKDEKTKKRKVVIDDSDSGGAGSSSSSAAAAAASASASSTKIVQSIKDIVNEAVESSWPQDEFEKIKEKVRNGENIDHLFKSDYCFSKYETMSMVELLDLRRAAESVDLANIEFRDRLFNRWLSTLLKNNPNSFFTPETHENWILNFCTKRGFGEIRWGVCRPNCVRVGMIGKPKYIRCFDFPEIISAIETVAKENGGLSSVWREAILGRAVIIVEDKHEYYLEQSWWIEGKEIQFSLGKDGNVDPNYITAGETLIARLNSLPEVVEANKRKLSVRHEARMWWAGRLSHIPLA